MALYRDYLGIKANSNGILKSNLPLLNGEGAQSRRTRWGPREMRAETRKARRTIPRQHP